VIIGALVAIDAALIGAGLRQFYQKAVS